MKELLCKDTLPQKVSYWGSEQPDKIAVASGKSSVTYKELNDMVDSCCGALTQNGAIKGEFIILSAVMKAEYVAAFLAVKKMRMIAVPVNKTASENEVREIISRVKSKCFLTDNPRYKSIKEKYSLNDFCKNYNGNNTAGIDENEVIPLDEVTEVLFTSGTTGKPKGAVHTQKGIAANIKNTSDGMDMAREDVLLIPLPLSHSFGLRVMRSALYNGETIVLQNGFSFAKEMQQNIRNWKCNCMVAVSTGFELLQQQMGEDYRQLFERMKYIEFSAGAVSIKMRRQLSYELSGVKLYNTWGSTETGGILFLEFSAEKDKEESAGKSINDIELAIIDDKGEHLKQGEAGRLAIKSNALFIGYYDDKELTEKTLVNGWLYTNDAAVLDKNGYVYLNGRVDDIINVGGEKVAPAEIERIISVQPGIRSCACIGVNDPKGILGQVPIAFIVADSKGYDKKFIEGQIRKFGNSYMIPAEYLDLDELPKNYMGKIDRKKLKKYYENSINKKTELSNGNPFADQVLNLIVSRRSVRIFKEQSVEKNVLNKLLFAGRMAPSSHNMQTWRFTVLQSQEKIRVLRETAKKIASEKKTLFYGFQNPQAVIIVSNDRRNSRGIQDSSAAIENILLLAHAFSLGACWIDALRQISDEPEIRELLNDYEIPENHIVHGLIGLGYPVSEPKTPVKKENVIKFVD